MGIAITKLPEGGKTGVGLFKARGDTSCWLPLEAGEVWNAGPDRVALTLSDGRGRCYWQRDLGEEERADFQIRGALGRQNMTWRRMLSGTEGVIELPVQAATLIESADGVYGDLAALLAKAMQANAASRVMEVDGVLRRLFVCWGRDHTHIMKVGKYFVEDVFTGIELFLEQQQANGMFWDDVHRNSGYPGADFFGEALGEGFYGYSGDGRHIFRRIPIEADVEFLYTECVWHVWKASGDDAWMRAQLPRLEKALAYNSSDPARWSEAHGLVRRSFCMDSWDFAHPFYCAGDHRCRHEEDPQFLFHSDNSGLYASYWRMAEMYAALGERERARELGKAGEQLRERANTKLFFGTHYGHMIPETLPAEEVYAAVGDERERMSLSTGYTINRGLPTHQMARAVLAEYQRRREAKREESFAEWWAMDPPYTKRQWPRNGPPMGEYMNGAICPIVAGELARAAFEHGEEAYGADILRRVWALAEADGHHLHQAYRRLPASPEPPCPVCEPLDLRGLANVGLDDRQARPGAPAWTSEGDNDMRGLPTGRRRFGAVEFEVIDPATNAGRAVLRLDPMEERGPSRVRIEAGEQKAQALYFLHAVEQGLPEGTVVGRYVIEYKDGTEQERFLRSGREIGHWWGVSEKALRMADERRDGSDAAGLGWQGANGSWKNVGLYIFGWAQPYPEKAIRAIRCEAVRADGRLGCTNDTGRGGLLLAAASLSPEPVALAARFRSYGLPDDWSRASVYYALAEGLGGIEDLGRGFDHVRVAPRWAATESRHNRVLLHYPASDGYCAYDYDWDAGAEELRLDLAGSFDRASVHCLLPPGQKATAVRLGDRAIPFTLTTVGESSYVDFELEGLPEAMVRINLREGAEIKSASRMDDL